MDVTSCVNGGSDGKPNRSRKKLIYESLKITILQSSKVIIIVHCKKEFFFFFVTKLIQGEPVIWQKMLFLPTKFNIIRRKLYQWKVNICLCYIFLINTLDHCKVKRFFGLKSPLQYRSQQTIIPSSVIIRCEILFVLENFCRHSYFYSLMSFMRFLLKLRYAWVIYIG